MYLYNFFFRNTCSPTDCKLLEDKGLWLFLLPLWPVHLAHTASAVKAGISLCQLSWFNNFFSLLQSATRWQAKTFWYLIPFVIRGGASGYNDFLGPEEDSLKVRLSYILQTISLKMSSASAFLHGV